MFSHDDNTILEITMLGLTTPGPLQMELSPAHGRGNSDIWMKYSFGTSQSTCEDFFLLGRSYKLLR